MPTKRPSNLTISQLLRRDLARKGPIGFIKHVLRGDLDLSFEMLAHEEEIEVRGGDDDLCCGRLGFNTPWGEGLGGGKRRGVPVLGSREALLRLCTMSVIDLMVPFLLWMSAGCLPPPGLDGLDTYILKFPPTKNWRPMIAVLGDVAGELGVVIEACFFFLQRGLL